MKKPYFGRLKKNILALAGQKGLTLEKLAIETDLSKSFISEFLAGKSSPSLETLKKIANALDVDVVDLLNK
jgi:transcriptional regulator with XRE-family HTH domain